MIHVFAQRQKPSHHTKPATASSRFAHDVSKIPLPARISTRIQPKLTVSTPGDIYEQEANRVANQVMCMPEPQRQRFCPCEGGCPRCRETASSSGRPLEAATRGFMESRFGHDFGMVRVHTDARAVKASQALRAEAFTFGNDIYFNERRFIPSSTEGKQLLAHELAHTIQQGSAVERKIQRREECDEFGRCQSIPDEEVGCTPDVAVAAGASLAPPGDCTWGEHRTLQDIVNKTCKRPRKCTPGDDCATIWQRIQDNGECIKARSTIIAKCFRGGDLGHTIAVADAVGALANCWTVYSRKCLPPPLVPEFRRVPVEETKPVVDRTFMEKMAALTGLTGTALIIYLILSEGSRVFLPRNLVPIP